jgi:hypothetical protein
MFELPIVYNTIVVEPLCEEDVWYEVEEKVRILHYTVAKPWTYTMKWSKLEDPFVCWFWWVEEYCMLWDMIDI